MIKALAHVCIYSNDLAKTQTFYQQALGLDLKFRFLKSGDPFGFYLQVADRQFIEVFRREEASAGIPQIGHICLETADLKALRQHLVGMGIDVTEPILGADHSWQMWTHDPDGTSIEFHQYTPESNQRSGNDCVVDW